MVNNVSRKLARRLRSATDDLLHPATARGRAGEDSANASSYSAPIAPLRDGCPPGPTVLLLNDCRDQDNFGAAVLVDGLVEILSQRLPTSEILPIPSHWVIDSSTWAGRIPQRRRRHATAQGDFSGARGSVRDSRRRLVER